MAITKVGDVTFDQAAWELKAYFALRPMLYHDKVADVYPTAQAHPGSTIKINTVTDLAAQSTALNESTDVTPLTMGDSTTTITLVEQGAAVQTTALVRGTSFIPYDPIVANAIGFNAGLSLDTIARDVLAGGSNVRYSGSAAGRTTVVPTSNLTAANVRRARVDLAGSNVEPFGNLYAAFAHPDVLYDLRGETGAAAWRDPHTYSAPAEIWSGETGSFEGFKFIETPQAKVFSDAGSSTTLTDVYASLFIGRQALAKGYSTTDGNGPMPRIIPSPVIDILRRFTGIGWYWLGGYSVFRQAALRRVESASTIGSNS